MSIINVGARTGGFATRGLAVANDLVGIGVLTGAAAASSPLLAGLLLAGGGVFVLDLVNQIRGQQDEEALKAMLNQIFSSTKQLRLRMPFSARIIERCQSGEIAIEDVKLPDGDPAAPAVEIYKAIKYDNGNMARALNWLMDATEKQWAYGEWLSAKLDVNESEVLGVLKDNHQALIDMIGRTDGCLKDRLDLFAQDLGDGLSDIKGDILLLRGDIDQLAELYHDGQLRVDVGLGEMRAATFLLLKKVDEQKRILMLIEGQILEPKYDAALRRIAADSPFTALQLREMIEEFSLKIQNQPQAGPWDQALAALGQRDFRVAAEKASEAYEMAVLKMKEKEDEAEVARKSAVQAAELVAQAFFERGKYLDALHAREQIVELSDRSRDPLERAHAGHEVAFLLEKVSRYEEAESILRDVVEVKVRLLGDKDLSVAESLNNLGLVMQEQGKLREADEIYARALEISESVLGSDHPDVAVDLNNIALLREVQGHVVEAERLYRRALGAMAKAGEEGDLLRATLMMNLADLLRTAGNLEEAESLINEAFGIRVKCLGETHVLVANDRRHLALLRWKQGFKEDARTGLEAALGVFFTYRKEEGCAFVHEEKCEREFGALLGDMGLCENEIQIQVADLKRQSGI